MVKIRLHGLPEEVERGIEVLKKLPEVKISYISSDYQDRGTSNYIRRYLDVEISTNVCPKGER